MSVSRSRIQNINFLQKAIENIVSLTTSASAQTTLSNGQGATFTITTTSTSGNQTIAIHDFTIYIGSVASGNWLPDGSNVDPTKWIVQTYINDWGATDNKDTVAKIYVQNVSAGSNQTVIIEEQGRLIQNSTTIGGSG